MVDIVTPEDIAELDWEVDERIEQYYSDLRNYIVLCSKDGITSAHKKYALNTLEKKWIPLLGFNKTDIKSDILDLSSPRIETIKSFTLKEALANYAPSNSWLIPNLLRKAGLYVLGGEPKVGKTILTYMLMKAVSTTGKFLDLPVKTGNVLFIQTEEGKSLIQDRLYLAGFGELSEEASLVANFLDRVRIELEFDINSNLNKLHELILEYKPVLTIIDSLRSVSGSSNISENSPEFAKPLYALQRVFNSTDTCGLIIHHMNKTKEDAASVSLVKAFSGSTAISAASDGLIGLFHTKTDDGTKAIKLRTLPRQGTELDITYRLEYEDGLWAIKKLADNSPAKHQITGLILNFLGQNIGEFFTEKIIAKEINFSTKDSKFRECLSYLETNQIISKVYKDKKFKYGLTQESNWVLNPVDLRSLVDPIILDANTLARCVTKSEIRELINNWGQDYSKQLMDYLLDNDIPKIRDLWLSWEYKEGDKVIYEGEIYEVVESLTEEPKLNNVKYNIRKQGKKKITVREDELKAYHEPEEEVTTEQEHQNTLELFEEGDSSHIKTVIEVVPGMVMPQTYSKEELILDPDSGFHDEDTISVNSEYFDFVNG